MRDLYEYASADFAEALDDLRGLVEGDLADLESELDELGAPWTPGRMPPWSR